MNLEAPNGMVLELLLHAGTLLAVLFFYRQRLTKMAVGLIKRDKSQWQYAAAVVLSCIPAGLLYGLAHKQIDQAVNSPTAISLLLMVTGALLLSLRLLPTTLFSGKLTWWKALVIGVGQAFAMLPGISRSGSTYVTGRWLKLGSQDAFDFSFIMSIPIIAGAILLKIKDLAEFASSGNMLALTVALFVAAAVGYAALWALTFIRVTGKFWCFGIYCIAIGILGLIF